MGAPGARETTARPPKAEPQEASAEIEGNAGLAEVRDIMKSSKYRRAAANELARETRLGFETALRCTPEEQLDLARFFGESIILIPKAALDSKRPIREYYVLDGQPPFAIRTVAGLPPLDQMRQYRDLFDFQYQRLPASIRSLRRKVASRADIYLFAAVIPVEEWALVAARREQAMREYRANPGRKPGEPLPVNRYTLRYVRIPGGGFDLEVDEIRFSDGSVYRPHQAM